MVMRPHLDERQWRLYLASEVTALGRGGLTRVAAASGVAPVTIRAGLKELEESPISDLSTERRVRRAGGGRKKESEKDPTLLKDLEKLVSPETRGDPMSPLRYTTKSTRQLSSALKGMGHSTSHEMVANILNEQGYSLQANMKTKEGTDNPDRDAQFRYINKQAIDHMEKGQPVISVDAKKKELVGEFKNAGQEWLPGGQPTQVNVHDFPSMAIGKAIPYGVYDVHRNSGWVNVGTDHDTAAFAVATIKRWWYNDGMLAYPNAGQLFITADGGGSNGVRNRLWKRELAEFAEESGLKITVSHLPPGTSKWNKIEHRLFSHISMNWKGQPLVSHEVVVGLINATTTAKGLRVKAKLDEGLYPISLKVSDEEIQALPVQRHEFHGEWNYTIIPSLYPKRQTKRKVK